MKTHALIGTVVLTAALASAQVPSFDGISHTVEVGTVAVALNPPEATIPKSMLATPQNIAALATVKTICVMPYDGWKTKSVIDALPSFDLIREGLASDKKLREQRNEASEELERVGFQTKDCLSAGATPPDAEIIFTNVAGRLRQYGPAYILLGSIREHETRYHCTW